MRAGAMSPFFPGMDPWLEAEDLWPEFQRALAAEIRAMLNCSLPPSYYAFLGHRFQSALTESEPLKHRFVEIRDSKRSHKLVTLIEFASPSNKRPGGDRKAYERKQQEVLESDASLVEIDLLRGGDRVIANAYALDAIDEIDPPPHYLVAVSRVWSRAVRGAYQFFPIRLQDPLPVIPVPLREAEEEVPLDLQYVFNQAYDSGPYARGAVDYSGQPEPSLRDDDSAWARQILRERQVTP